MIFFSFFMGVLGSFIASIIFVFTLRMYRPKIEIAENIAEWGSAAEKKQTIKVINKGRRSAVDLRFELLIVTLKSVPDGILRSTRTIALKKPNAFILYGFSKNDRDAKFARRVSIAEDLDDIWSDDDQQFLIFRVYCQDEVSGFSKLFEMEYRTKRNSIKFGQYHSGNSFKIS